MNDFKIVSNYRLSLILDEESRGAEKEAAAAAAVHSAARFDNQE